MWKFGRKSRMETLAPYGVGTAAALVATGTAYFLDPVSGPRRRAVVRDQFYKLRKNSRELLSKAESETEQRAENAYHSTKSWFQRKPPDDRILADRVRDKLRRLTAHPRAIQVECRDGTAYLRGDILERELGLVLRGVSHVSGVTDVESELRTHDKNNNVPALQGEGASALQRFDLLQSNWSPILRFVTGAAATAMVVGGIVRRGPTGYALAATGAALLVRSISNAPLTRLVGIRSRKDPSLLSETSIDVDAEVDEVYSCWRNLEQLPQFMTHVREVRKLDGNRYHWVVEGPAGATVEWNSKITADVPNELIAWRTEEDSTVQSSGTVHFEPTASGGTRVHVRMTYRPPANTLDRKVSKMLGRDPTREIDDDMQRFKRFVESGATQGAVRH